MKNRSKTKKEMKKKMKKEMISTSKVKKSKRTSKDARSKDCLASSDMIFVDAAVYNLLFKQKNVKLFVISLKNIDDQIQKDTDIFIDSKIILSEKFHDLIDVFFKIASVMLRIFHRYC